MDEEHEEFEYIVFVIWLNELCIEYVDASMLLVENNMSI